MIAHASKRGNMANLKGKTSIITGASRGIGRAIAERFGREGANVVVNYAGNQKAADEVVHAIESSGAEAISIQGDMSKLADVQRLFDQAETRFGAPNIVVSAAAISVFKPHVDLTDDDFDKLFNLNTRGVFYVLREAARRVQDGGRIIQFSTGGTKMPMAGGGLYAATKAAGEQFALALAINVNLISPGVTATDGLIMPQEAINALIGQTPLGRLGQPEDIADAVLFLASDDSRWVTGQNLQVNGGIL
jgi:3-oxoacyl-[acyl-carrier protein] reductase